MPREQILEHWTALILERFQCFSIPFPKGEHVSTQDYPTIKLFMDKYPEAQAAMEQAHAKIQENFPRSKFTLELHSDPEGCHTCNEGQKLWLEVEPTTEELLEPLGEFISDLLDDPLIWSVYREGLFFICHTL